MTRILMALGIALAGLSAGCASTMQARNVQPSGFLGEYRAMLRAGEKEEALLRYRNPKVDWASYDSILLEPVPIWSNPERTFSPDQQRELQQLVDHFYDMLYLKLSEHYRIVDKPDRGTMRVRAAISHGERSLTGLTFLSKAIPQLRATNALWTLRSGKPAFAGEVTIEAIVQDAQTGELLAVGADRRVGGRNLFDEEVFNSWGDVKNGLEFWTSMAAYRLCLLRGDTACTKPSA